MERLSLETHFLFQRVDPVLLGGVIRASSCLQIARGQSVCHGDGIPRCLGILLDGVLQVRKESLLISTLRRGEVFGAEALFGAEGDCPFVLTAKTECSLLLIPEEEIRRLLGTSSEFAEDYAVYLSGRIRFLSARLSAVSADGGENKLVRYLLTADHGSGAVTQSATQLCQRIGIGRATLYRAFELLETEGFIRREGKTIHILDRRQLSARFDLM